jgi:hypothetical protein
MERFARGSRGRGFPITNSHSTWYIIWGQVTTERKPMSERLVASTLGLTVTAAQRAAALDRIMRSRGLTDPYVPLREAPLDYPKLRRHLHPRYHFDPLPGFPIEPW